MIRLLAVLLVPCLPVVSHPLLSATAPSFASWTSTSARDPVSSSAVTDRAAAWVWPVAGTPAVARGYEAPATRYAAGHRGIDLVAGTGAEVLAPSDGTIVFADRVAGRPVLALEHGGGYRSSLEPVLSTLAVGTPVQRGQPVGTLADGGHCAGCLHVGVRLRGEYLDPRALITGVPRAILLPGG